jgi:hypothetical protein
MKKFIFYIVAVILIILLSLPWTWQSIYRTFGNSSANAQLHVRSLFGDYEVYIDNNLIGQVKDKEIKLFPQIQSGKREIKLVRIAEENDFFHIFTREIDFLPNSRVTIEWESGPTLESSNGMLRYFSPSRSPDGTQIVVIPFPPNAKVYFDGTESAFRQIIVSETKSINIKVESDEIYESQDIEIELSTIEKNIKHTVEIYLYRKPV